MRDDSKAQPAVPPVRKLAVGTAVRVNHSGAHAIVSRCRKVDGALIYDLQNFAGSAIGSAKATEVTASVQLGFEQHAALDLLVEAERARLEQLRAEQVEARRVAGLEAKRQRDAEDAEWMAAEPTVELGEPVDGRVTRATVRIEGPERQNRRGEPYRVSHSTDVTLDAPSFREPNDLVMGINWAGIGTVRPAEAWAFARMISEAGAVAQRLLRATQPNFSGLKEAV